MANIDGASTAGSKAVVKWYNPNKGFGFVTLEDGTDAFCHASALSAIGVDELPPGATVFCDVSETQRGMQVSAVHNVDLSTADPDGGHGGTDRHGGHAHSDAPSGPMEPGQIKFFNEQKGFGFAVPDSGAADVYIHASALRRSGLSNLQSEQRIRFSTRQGKKGVEVDRIELA
nr:MAG: cold-shock protein [Hyphomicrobiales bacterium]